MCVKCSAENTGDQGEQKRTLSIHSQSVQSSKEMDINQIVTQIILTQYEALHGSVRV